jgi:hypothetical protein
MADGAANFDNHLTNAMAARVEAQQQLLLLDHRALSGLLGNSLLAGNAQAFNTSARIPVTLASGDAGGQVKGV